MENNFDKNVLLFSSKFINQKEYWMNKLSGMSDETETCFEYSYNDEGNKECFSEIVDFTIPKEVFEQLARVCKNNELSIYIFLLSVLKVLIYRYMNQQQITIISPLFTQKISYDTVNDRVFILDNIEPEMTFKDLLMSVRNSVLEGYENQDYPYEKIIENAFNSSRSKDRVQVSDIVCSLSSIHNSENLKSLYGNICINFAKNNDLLNAQILYNKHRYDKAFAEQISKHFLNLLKAALKDVNEKIFKLPILSLEEKYVLMEFNNNKFDLSGIKSVPQLIEEQAMLNPDKIAVACNNSKLTYMELNQKANQLARTLIESGVTKDKPVGILLERGLSMIVSMLAIWKAGGAYIPLDTDYPVERVLDILNDSGTKVLITISKHIDDDFQVAYKQKVIKLDKEEACISTKSVENCEVDIDLNSLAYIIYTSGSTGKPKGAMVEHIGMLNHTFAKINELGMNSETIMAQNASHTFDISVWQFFASLVVGGSVIIYPKETILDLEYFVPSLIGDGVTILEVVPSYLALLLDYLGTENIRLVSINYLLVTGEIVKPVLIKKWFELNPNIKVVNAYGPTEASDDITHCVMDNYIDMSRVPIGKPVQNMNIYIVDKNMQLCPIGVKGELCVSGIGVGRGYIGDEEKTKKVFMTDPFVKNEVLRLYKTGDVGRWLANGMIDFYGREDNQVKIRGFRIELGEIESKLSEYPGIKESVVIDKEDKQGNKYLCAYVILENKIDGSELKKHLLKSLPEYMIPSSIIELETMPLTRNGKVDRKSLKDYENDLEYLKYISSDEIISTHDSEDFKPSSSTHIKQNVHSSKREEDTFKDYTEAINNYNLNNRKAYYPLSYNQRMFYYIEKVYSGSACSNDVATLRYKEILDISLLNKAVNTILKNNDSLRLRIVEINTGLAIEPAQYISDYQEYKLECYDFSNKNDKILDKWIDENTNKAFSLIDSQLFSISYIKYSEVETGYFVKLHHLICDGWSLDYLCSLIDSVYKQLKLKSYYDDKSLNDSYIKYLNEEKKYVESEQFDIDRKFWHKTMIPAPAEVDLSSKKGDKLATRVASKKLVLPLDLFQSMFNYCEKNNISYFKLLFSAFSIYISRVKSMDDFVIGYVNHGRTNKHLKNILGLFSNFTPVRVNVDQNTTFNKLLLKECSVKIFESLQYSQYPYQVLTTEISSIIGNDCKYLSNIIMVDQPTYYEKDFVRTVHLTNYESNPLTMYINLNNSNVNDSLELHWLYQVELFDEMDIIMLHESLVKILYSVMCNPDIKVADIDILPDTQKNYIINELNNTKRDYLSNKRVHMLFEEQVERTPDKVAVVFGDNSITYRDLNCKANQLAKLLKSKGLEDESIIGLRVKRSIEMIIGILAILKAGGAYLPIGHEQPDKRVRYMLEECKSNILLTDNSDYTLQVEGNYIETINIFQESIYSGDSSNLSDNKDSRTQAYVCYTSGSTGLPKGVIIEHRSLVNFIHGMSDVINFNEDESILSLINISFDIFFMETILPLTKGMKVVIGSSEEQANIKAIAKLINEQKITMLQATPSMLHAMVSDSYVNESLSKLKYLLVGGEIFTETLHNKLCSFFKAKIFNLYGPTETTIWSTIKDVSIGNSLNIGKPIANTQIYILDEAGFLQAIGTPGEMYIGGDGVARGYICKQDLTDEKFIENPFIPGEHLYKTGDVARWLWDGNIEFVGREDDQVKINGLRIELTEIENSLMKFSGISDGAVVVNEHANSRVLYAFVVAERKLLVSEVREFLIERLPLYMIPSFFIQLEKMPLTISGKTNRKLLKDMKISIINEVEHIIPQNYIEKVIAGVWEEVLGKSDIGIYDNFFDLGGNSLKLIQVNSKLKQKLGEDIPIVLMFQYPTISLLYKYISSKNTGLDSNKNDETLISEDSIEDALALFEGVSSINHD